MPGVNEEKRRYIEWEQEYEKEVAEMALVAAEEDAKAQAQAAAEALVNEQFEWQRK